MKGLCLYRNKHCLALQRGVPLPVVAPLAGLLACCFFLSKFLSDGSICQATSQKERREKQHSQPAIKSGEPAEGRLLYAPWWKGRTLHCARGTRQGGLYPALSRCGNVNGYKYLGDGLTAITGAIRSPTQGLKHRVRGRARRRGFLQRHPTECRPH